MTTLYWARYLFLAALLLFALGCLAASWVGNREK